MAIGPRLQYYYCTLCRSVPDFKRGVKRIEKYTRNNIYKEERNLFPCGRSILIINISLWNSLPYKMKMATNEDGFTVDWTD